MRLGQPLKQHRSVSVHRFKCFGGLITTSASFPSQERCFFLFFLRTQEIFYLIELLGCRSYLKEKNPLWLFWGSVFSTSPLTPAEQDPNIMETIWNTTSLPVSCSRTKPSHSWRGRFLLMFFPPHIYKMSISMFSGSWTAAVAVSRSLSNETNRQENQPVTTAVGRVLLCRTHTFVF